MKILSIDTSCDETSVAITEGRRVLSHVEWSQVKVHQDYGGVFPSLAKREHLSKMGPATSKALKRSGFSLVDMEAIAVTFGPGLPPALEVGVNYAKELAGKYGRKLIPIDHIEGHIYSAFTQNSRGNPSREFRFPILVFVISGGHTELIHMKGHVDYEIIGETLDDAAGEALDKAARMLGLGYPGGPIIEKLAQSGNGYRYKLPLPMGKHKDLRFSYSGLKTAFKRLLESLPAKERLDNLADLAASFQHTVFTSLLAKLELALKEYKVNAVAFGGGVSANRELKKRTRRLLKKHGLPLYFPPLPYLSTDNAAMIGVAAYYKAQKGIFLMDPEVLDRVPRANLDRYMAANHGKI